jgi:Terminase-like family.
MAERKFYSKLSQKIQSGAFDNFDSPESHDPVNEESIDYDAWMEYISFYRHHIDLFCTQVLKLKLYPFQCLILRAMARHQYSMLICCRGLGKSYLTAVFFIACAILYPNIKCGIASGKGQQARNVIIQKIKGELSKNENVAREILFPIKTGADDCVVNFKNGSEIRAIVLGQNQSGDGARSWRFNYILIDEARIVKSDVVEEILIPMTKTKRPNIIHYGKDAPVEKGKVIFISSAYLKTCDLYKRFRYHYDKMIDGSKDYFVCSLDYRVGIDSGIFYEDDIMEEKNKPTMTSDKFLYEYGGIFVGSSNSSYYPYDITEPCRILDTVELEQPKKSTTEYIIYHDVAVADSKDADNACTGVLKLKQKSNGTYTKELVYMKTYKGKTLQQQRDELRELIHLKFPNTIKMIIDIRGNGTELPKLFYETWEYKDPKSGQTLEFPPLVLDDDEEAIENINGSIPIIRGIEATNSFNNTMYTYMKACFENGSIRLPSQSSEMDEFVKSKEITAEEYAIYMDTDFLIQELSNIQQTNSEAGNIVYKRIVNTMKRDRATALGYGLSYVSELEQENRKNLYSNSYDYSDFIFLN